MAYNDEKKSSEDLSEIHSTALKQFDDIQSAVYDERQQNLNDRRFYSIAGAQWEGDLETFFENKPKIEVNKIHLSVIRIINEYRNNKITVDFTSKDGMKNDNLADTCDGLYRADENDSNADEAYDNAFEEAVGGGIGAWRLRADFEDPYDDEDERQRIFIEPIYDADSSVFFDLNSEKQDKSDSNYCFVIKPMTREAYKKEYKEEPVSVDKSITNVDFDWTSPDIVYVAEYYIVEIKDKIIRIFETLIGEEERFSQEEFDNDEEKESLLIAQGYKEVRQKKVKQKKIYKYILSGNKILEECGCIAGNNIPIIMTFGKRWVVDSIERTMGHVRLARDAQILKNIQLSKLAEIAALSPVEKPIVTPEQMAGHQNKWEDDNTKNYPYLFLNPIEDVNGNIVPAGPLAYTKPPQVPPALAAIMQITDQDIREVLGNQEAGEKMVSNISGKAIEMIQDKLDMQTFIYMSNMAKSMKRSGEVWLSMAKDIFVEEDRDMKVIDKEGNSSIARIGIPYEGEDGKVKYQNDLTKAKFGVNAEVGPATSSKKQATIRSLTEALTATADPETQSVITGLMMLNMEGEGLSDIRPFFRNKLIKMGAIEPNKEEQQRLIEEAQKRQPTAEDNYLQAEAVKAQANAQKAEADTVKSIAQTEETKAKTAEILAGIDREDREQVLKIVNEIDQSFTQSAVSAPPLQKETDEK